MVRNKMNVIDPNVSSLINGNGPFRCSTALGKDFKAKVNSAIARSRSDLIESLPRFSIFFWLRPNIFKFKFQEIKNGS